MSQDIPYPFTQDCPLGMAEEVYEVERVEGRQREAEDQLRGPSSSLLGQDHDPQQGNEDPVPHLCPDPYGQLLILAAADPVEPVEHDYYAYDVELQKGREPPPFCQGCDEEGITGAQGTEADQAGRPLAVLQEEGGLAEGGVALPVPEVF